MSLYEHAEEPMPPKPEYDPAMDHPEPEPEPSMLDIRNQRIRRNMITLKTLPNATKQEVFDQVASHLLKQMKHSKRHSGACAYRGTHELKCAAGCLIADDEYMVKFDNGCNGISWTELVKAGLVPVSHKDLIVTLQDIHDCYEPVSWEERLKLLAEKEGLEFKEPTNYSTNA
jgi:hypothetical protein